MANTGIINIKTNTYIISATLRQHVAPKLFLLSSFNNRQKYIAFYSNVLPKNTVTEMSSVAQHIRVTYV